jgi:hypothetical protein
VETMGFIPAPSDHRSRGPGSRRRKNAHRPVLVALWPSVSLCRYYERCPKT